MLPWMQVPSRQQISLEWLSGQQVGVSVSLSTESPLTKMFHLFLVALVLTFFILIPQGQKPHEQTLTVYHILHWHLHSHPYHWCGQEMRCRILVHRSVFFLILLSFAVGEVQWWCHLFVLFSELCSWACYFFYLAFWYSFILCPEGHYQISLEPYLLHRPVNSSTAIYSKSQMHALWWVPEI